MGVGTLSNYIAVEYDVLSNKAKETKSEISFSVRSAPTFRHGEQRIAFALRS